MSVVHLHRKVRRQIASAGVPAIVVLRVNRDGEALLELRRKRSRRGGFTLNLSAAAARLLPHAGLPQLGFFTPDARPRTEAP